MILHRLGAARGAAVTSFLLFRPRTSENTKTKHNPPAQPQHTQGHPPVRSLGHWGHFWPKYMGLKGASMAARMRLISEFPPAALQSVIRGLGRKNKRAHVALSTCFRSRGRRGSRWPTVDAETASITLFDFLKNEVNDKEGLPPHRRPSTQGLPQ